MRIFTSRNLSLLAILPVFILLLGIGVSEAQEHGKDQVQEISPSGTESVTKAAGDAAVEPSPRYKAEPQKYIYEQERQNEDVQAHYVESTYDNIFKLMWMMGVFKVENPEDVKDYIRISECNLHRKYYNDDFEWKKIKAATEAYLKEYAPSFSKYIEIVQPLSIDRYDFNLRGFTLRPANQLVNVSAIQMHGGLQVIRTECGNVNPPDGRYSGSAILRLRSPITIGYLRLDEGVAKEYLRYVEEKQGDLKVKPAYIRYRVRIDRYISTENIPGLGFSQIFSGKVLKVDIFADREMFLPLFSQSYD